MRQLKIIAQTWPVVGKFTISRSSLSEIQVIRVEITQGDSVGRGECRPYARYDETPETVTEAISAIQAEIEKGLSREALLSALPAGAARNAIDCALWDLEAKVSEKKVWELAGLPQPRPRETAYTLSMDTPDNMAFSAKNAEQFPILKMKIGGFSGLAACKAVAKARPDAALIIDANEALGPRELEPFQNALEELNVLMIEQPLPAADFDKAKIDPKASPIICADESLHNAEDLYPLWDAGYRAVNVKLDKCGGLTAGITLMQAAQSMGFTIMAGCMVGTSLAMAPMMMLESFADVIDLDGPLLLQKDVVDGLIYGDATVHPPNNRLWG